MPKRVTIANKPQMRILNQNERGIVAVNPDHVAGISIVDGECDIFMSNGTKHHVIMGDDKLTLTDAEKLDTLARRVGVRVFGKSGSWVEMSG